MRGERPMNAGKGICDKGGITHQWREDKLFSNGLRSFVVIKNKMVLHLVPYMRINSSSIDDQNVKGKIFKC